MKKLAIQLTLPLTIISMFIITKWWYAIPVDGPDKLYWGFPFAFMGEGFHTSLSLQFFVLEFLADFMVYFTVVLLLVLAFTKWFPTFQISKIITKTVWVLSFTLLIGFSFVVTTSTPIFKIKRDYDWRVMATGHVFFFQATPRPDITHFIMKSYFSSSDFIVSALWNQGLPQNCTFPNIKKQPQYLNFNRMKIRILVMA